MSKTKPLPKSRWILKVTLVEYGVRRRLSTRKPRFLKFGAGTAGKVADVGASKKRLKSGKPEQELASHEPENRGALAIVNWPAPFTRLSARPNEPFTSVSAAIAPPIRE